LRRGRLALGCFTCGCFGLGRLALGGRFTLAFGCRLLGGSFAPAPAWRLALGVEDFPTLVGGQCGWLLALGNAGVEVAIGNEWPIAAMLHLDALVLEVVDQFFGFGFLLFRNQF